MRVDAALLESDLSRCAPAAQEYERLGFDGVLSFEGPHDPFIQLALVAQQTERVELTTAIAIAFARNPMVCAYMANDLQLASQGRFILGLGTQIRTHIEKRFGQPWSRPNSRMREFVQAIRAIWRAWNEDQKLAFRGEFYSHTLMTPIFNPGRNPYGTPPIHLAGFGPGMVRVAGEVADGWIVHPLHTRAYLRDIALPALDEGLAAGGRSRSDCSVSCQVITMVGDSDEQIAKARSDARAQIAFYSSTPAYRVVLDHHGWGDLQPELNRMSKEGKWLDMIGLVNDDMLDEIGVSGHPGEIAAKIKARNDFADRVTLVLYNEAGPEAASEIVRGLHTP